MKIFYTKHAEMKFQILKRHNFTVTKEQIRDILENPEGIRRGRKNRLIAQKSTSETHLIRVAWGTGISTISLNCYQLNLSGRDIRKKRGEQARLARAKRESASPIEPSRGDISPLEYPIGKKIM